MAVTAPRELRYNIRATFRHNWFFVAPPTSLPVLSPPPVVSLLNVLLQIHSFFSCLPNDTLRTLRASLTRYEMRFLAMERRKFAMLPFERWTVNNFPRVVPCSLLVVTTFAACSSATLQRITHNMSTSLYPHASFNQFGVCIHR